ncbi:sialate O-acetylesterase [Caulobacter sp. RL271]|uniref:Sialate O-acetylesterase n=1 Tax=Caulobacter segnis TaxID=88688 RepID=A0ABY4ZYF5_9CAUL|nr:sialate O-acetylesterase [Caulobacter segnis]USQ97229.1 sialate O-acetylesterase [Caulobacter segnis]
MFKTFLSVAGVCAVSPFILIGALLFLIGTLISFAVPAPAAAKTVPDAPLAVERPVNSVLSCRSTRLVPRFGKGAVAAIILITAPAAPAFADDQAVALKAYVNSSTTAGISAAGGLTRAEVPTLADVGATTTKPYVLVLAGQSNANGRDHSGDKTNPANTFITSTMNGGTTFVPAAFGTAPLNQGPGGVGTTSDPAQATNNMGVHFANALRASGLIPASRPIVIIMNAVGGQSITQWVGSGASSAYFVNLKSSLAALTAAYPGAKIDHVIWSQGEGDNNASGTSYASKSTYISAFSALLGQWRALPEWQSSTTVSVQELGDWGDAIQRDRNDAIYTMRSGLFDPYVTTVSSAGIGESTDSPQFHFDGVGLATLGRYHFQAWHEARISGGYSPGHLSADTASAPIFSGGLSVATSGTLNVGVGDLRGGGVSINVTGTGATINLPRAATVGRTEVTFYQSTGAAFTLSAATSTIFNETGAPAGSVTVGSGQNSSIYRATSEPASDRWLLESVYPKIGSSKRYFTNVPSGQNRSVTTSEILHSIITLNASGMTLPTSGLQTGSSVVAYAVTGPSTVTASGSVAFQFEGGGPTVQSITLNAGEWVELTWASSVYIVHPSSRLKVVLPKPSASTLLASQAGSVITNEGATAISAQTLPAASAGLTYTAVVQDGDGIRLVAGSGNTIRIGASVSAVAGNIQATTIGNTVTLAAINSTEWVATAVNGTWTVN